MIKAGIVYYYYYKCTDYSDASLKLQWHFTYLILKKRWQYTYDI